MSPGEKINSILIHGKTQVTLNLIAVITLLSTAVAGTNMLNDIRNDIRAATSFKWSSLNMMLWETRLGELNPEIEKPGVEKILKETKSWMDDR